MPQSERPDPEDNAPMTPLEGSTTWVQTGSAVVQSNLEEATLIVRLGLAVNALRSQQQFTLLNSTAASGAGKMRDGVWGFLTAAAYTSEAVNILTGTGGVAGNYSQIVELAEAGGADESALKKTAQISGGSHPARAVIVRVRNQLGFHWDPGVVQASLRQYENPTLIWVEGTGDTRAETVYRLSAEVLSNAIAPVVPESPLPANERFRAALGHVFDAMIAIEHVFEHAILGFSRSMDTSLVELRQDRRHR